MISNNCTFEVKNRQAPRDAMKKFELGSVWIVQKPAMVLRAKAEFNGAPIKETLLLAPPTKLDRIATADPRAELPSRFITPALSLTNILGLRKTRAVDFAAVVESVSASRPVQKKDGGSTEVLDVVFLDGSKTEKGFLAECTASMWDEAGNLFTGKVDQKRCLPQFHGEDERREDQGRRQREER